MRQVRPVADEDGRVGGQVLLQVTAAVATVSHRPASCSDRGGLSNWSIREECLESSEEAKKCGNPHAHRASLQACLRAGSLSRSLLVSQVWGSTFCYRVKKMLDDYKRSVGWDDKHFIGVHIRRTDLAITAPDVRPPSCKSQTTDFLLFAEMLDSLQG